MFVSLILSMRYSSILFIYCHMSWLLFHINTLNLILEILISSQKAYKLALTILNRSSRMRTGSLTYEGAESRPEFLKKALKGTKQAETTELIIILCSFRFDNGWRINNIANDKTPTYYVIIMEAEISRSRKRSNPHPWSLEWSVDLKWMEVKSGETLRNLAAKEGTMFWGPSRATFVCVGEWGRRV